MTPGAFAPRGVRGIDAQIAFYTLAVRIERMRRCVAILLEHRKMQLPNLQALVSEFDKLRTEVESDARKVIDENIAATRARKQNTFDNVKKKIGQIDSQIGEINQFFDAIDKATNGPPPSPGSQQSPVSAQPDEAANLNQGTAG